MRLFVCVRLFACVCLRPQWLSIDKLVCHEKSRWEMEWLHYGNTERYFERWAKEYDDDLRHFFGYFQAMKGPLGSRMVLSGQTSVPWEVEIKYFTIGWFYYGNTVRYSLERWTKEYLMIWGFFLCCFQAMKGPLGSRMVLNGQTSVLWEVEIKYSTMGWFHNGNTERYSLERWTKGYLMIWGILFAVM